MQGLDLTRAPRTDPLTIYRLRDGMYAADLLIAAIAHFDFFSWLADHPSDKAAICRHFAIHERPTDVMLTLGEYEEFLTAAGFTGIEYSPTVADRGRMVACKPGVP